MVNSTVTIVGDLGESNMQPYRCDIRRVFGDWITLPDGFRPGDDAFDFDAPLRPVVEPEQAADDEFDFDFRFEDVPSVPNVSVDELDLDDPDYPPLDDFLVDLTRKLEHYSFFGCLLFSLTFFVLVLISLTFFVFGFVAIMAMFYLSTCFC